MQDLWGRSHRLRSQLAFPYAILQLCQLSFGREDASTRRLWVFESSWICDCSLDQPMNHLKLLSTSCLRKDGTCGPNRTCSRGKVDRILVWCTIENGRLMKISENTSHPACCNSGQWRLGTVNGSCWWFTVANWGDVQKSCSECTCWGCAYSSPKTLSKHSFMSDNIQQDLRVSKR